MNQQPDRLVVAGLPKITAEITANAPTDAGAGSKTRIVSNADQEALVRYRPCRPVVD
jgi:hypothetical protein